MTQAQGTESPRRVTFAPEVTDSPKSVVWEDPPLLPPDSFDDHDHEESLELPSLSQISANLQKLVMQSAHSKASYRAKLGKLAKELQDANRSVQVIEQELRTARERQSTVQRAIEEAKQRREEEAERLNLRRLQLQVMGRCMVDMEFLADIQDIQEKESNNTDKYERLSSLELAVVRQRLEEIRAMLDKADKAKTSKGYDSTQSETLRREAVSTFVLFHKFSQI